MIIEEIVMLQTEIPPTEEEVQARIDSIMEKFKTYSNPGLARLMQFAGFGDVETSGEGCILRTLGGKEYLDFVGGFGVFSVGHCHPRVIAAA